MRVRSSILILVAIFALTALFGFSASYAPPDSAQGPLPLTALVTVTPAPVGEPTTDLVTVTPFGGAVDAEGTPLGSGLVTVTPLGGDPDAIATQFFSIAGTDFPFPTSFAPGCSQAFPLERGTVVTIRPGVAVRYAPSVSAPLLITPLQNTDAVIVDGPFCSDEYVWWGVSNLQFTGWMAERNINLTFFREFSLPRPLACADALPLTIGQVVNTTANVRVRQAPSTDALVNTVALTGTPVTILSEAQCHSGLNWRRVRATVANFTYEGWLAEGQADRAPVIFLDAFADAELCYPSLGFRVDELVRVYYRSGPPKYLRDAPGDDSNVLFSLVSGVPLRITGASVCLDGMNWWPVRVLSSIPVEGWIAEGGRPIPSIRPFDEPPLPFLGR